MVGVVVVFVSAGLVSYVRALTESGYATTADKTSAWMHDNHSGALVTVVETWLYSRHRPSRLAADPHQFHTNSGAAHASPLTLARLPIPVGGVHEPSWVAGRPGLDGVPLSYSARFEPDPAYPSVVAGVSVISRRAHISMGLGTREMLPSDPTSIAQIPETCWNSMVASFNSGFRFADITGGLYHHHRDYRPLQDGQASIIIDDAGHIRIGKWGRDVHMTPTVMAVRQNLGLIVDAGRPLPVLGDGGLAWGGARLESQYTWRSGLGVDRDGNLIYVAGDMMNLPTLARALTLAGATTAMELDMHSGNSGYAIWPTTQSQRGPHRLLETMPGSAYRYMVPDRRDFFYATTNRC